MKTDTIPDQIPEFLFRRIAAQIFSSESNPLSSNELTFFKPTLL